MLKKIVLILSVILSSALIAGEELTIYTYESLGWIKEKAVPEFEKKNNCKVNIVTFTDAGNIIGRVKLEKKNPKADLAIGLTQSLVIMAKKEGLIEKYKSKNIGNIKDKSYIFDEEGYTTPYDYGALALVYDPEKFSGELDSFESLTKLDKKIILEDPKNSSTGQDFLLWTVAVYKDKWKDYWKKLKPAILTVTPGWSEAFAKFEAGEAPMMLSYATDGAYSFENYKSTKYKAFIPKDGAFLQIEGCSVVKNGKNRKMAEKFIDFMLEDTVQNEIPLKQWMFPVTNVKLPDSYKYAIVPEKVVSLTNKEIGGNIEKWIKEWEAIMKER